MSWSFIYTFTNELRLLIIRTVFCLVGDSVVYIFSAISSSLVVALKLFSVAGFPYSSCHSYSDKSITSYSRALKNPIITDNIHIHIAVIMGIAKKYGCIFLTKVV